MTRQHHVHLHLDRPPKGGVEVVQFEPQQDAVAVRPVCPVGDRAVMVLDFKGVELQDEFAVPGQPFVLGTSVSALESEQTLVPATAGFHVSDGDEWLWSHAE